MTLNFRPIVRAPYVPVPVPEAHELHGDEALTQWLAAHASIYGSQEERSFAPTAVTPLTE